MPVAYRRATTIAKTLSDQSNLIDWKARLTLAGAGADPRLAAEAARLSPDDPGDKRHLNRLAREAFRTAGGESKSERGTWLHYLSECVDKGTELPSHTDADAADMRAYEQAVKPLMMRHIEQPVVNHTYRVAGTADRIAEADLTTPDGTDAGLIIADLKTGNVDYAALSIAIQLAAYAHGVNYDPLRWLANPGREESLAKWKKCAFSAEQAAACYGPSLAVNQKWALVIHMPAGTGTARLLWVDIAAGWEALQVASDVREWRSRKDLLIFSRLVS